MTEDLKLKLSAVAVAVAMTAFALYLLGNPFDDVALVTNPQSATATLQETFDQDWEDRSRSGSTEVGVYEFTVDGEAYRLTDASLAPQIAVEYVEGKPQVNRAVGDGPQSLLRVALNAVMCLLIAVVGIGGAYFEIWPTGPRMNQ